jgi:hypothetical protein
MQHLAALTRDEVTAEHVNLYRTALPGDLYRYVGGHVWETLNSEIAKIPSTEYANLERVIANVKDLRGQIQGAEARSDRRLALTKQYNEYREANKNAISAAAPVFWHKITDAKEQRKIVKR